MVPMFFKNAQKIKNLEAQLNALAKRLKATEDEQMWQFLYFMRLEGKSGTTVEEFAEALEELREEYREQTFNSSLN